MHGQLPVIHCTRPRSFLKMLESKGKMTFIKKLCQLVNCAGSAISQLRCRSLGISVVLKQRRKKYLAHLFVCFGCKSWFAVGS